MHRDSDAINEFTDGEYARCAPFPDTFLFGKMYGRNKGPLSESECRHCLLHCGKRPARERTFLFSEFDKRQRHQNCLGVSLKTTASKKQFQKLSEEFRDRGFQRDLQRAVRCPTGKIGKRILRKIVPLLKHSGRKTPLGTFERHDEMGKVLAMGREYGSASCMMTFAMDDVNSANVVLMAVRSTDNINFPTLAPRTALERLKHGRLIGEGNVDCSYAGLAKLANENPVAVAFEFKKLVMNVMAILVGIKPETMSTKSFYRGWSNRGVVVGRAVAFIGVTETQVSACILNLIPCGNASLTITFPSLCSLPSTRNGSVEPLDYIITPAHAMSCDGPVRFHWAALTGKGRPPLSRHHLGRPVP